MQSSNNSLISDLILEKVRQKASALEKPAKIIDIVEMIKAECFALKKHWIEENILVNYNLTFEQLGAKPETIIKDAVSAVRYCDYPYEFSFIVLGLEPSKEAHLYTMNQDGEYWLQDSLGFATIGSGGELAFLELTKHGYARYFPAVMAIPRTYIAKKVSERAQGVGRYTDLLILFLNEPKTDKFLPMIQVLSTNQGFIQELDKTYNTIVANEKTELDKLTKTVFDLLTPKPSPKPTQTPTETPSSATQAT
jgi:hypothetical protein